MKKYVALDKRSGEQVWNVETQVYSWSSPTAFYTEDGKGYLIYCTSGGYMYLLDGLTGEMLELLNHGTPNIVCIQPFACLPNHVVGKGVIKEIRRRYPEANIVAVDYDPGASEVNQLNRIKLMLAVAFKNAGITPPSELE